MLEQKGPLIACDIIRWNDPYPPPVVELALRLNALSLERGAGVLMLDGPQAWKSDDNGQEFARVAERALNTPAKMGLPGTVLPGTYERFVGYCLALYDALGRLGWQRLATRQQPATGPNRILVESYPHAAWKSLGIPPLPAENAKCRVSHLAEAYAALTELLPITTSRPPNHDQLQDHIVGGLPGLAIEEQVFLSRRRNRKHTPESRIVGQPQPRWEGGYWREGFIALPLPPKTARSAVRSIRWTD